MAIEQAEIDVCIFNDGSTMVDGVVVGGTPHEPHRRWSLYARPQRRLFCLGYYDQSRQLNEVWVSTAEPPEILAEGGKPWERRRA